MSDIVERLRAEGADAMRKHLSLGMHQLCAEAADDLERQAAEIAELKSRIPEPSVNRLYRAINGLDGDDADKRARIFIASALEGWIPEQSRAQVQLILAQNFEELYQRVEQKAAEIKRLRAENAKLVAQFQERNGIYERDVDQLGAEIERLREALEQITELETLEDGKLSTSGEISCRALGNEQTTKATDQQTQ